MCAFKQRASVGQNANVEPPERRWWGCMRWGIDSFSAFLTTTLLSCCLLFTGLAQAADPVDCENWWFDPGEKGESASDLVQTYKSKGIFSDGNVCYKETRADFIYILVTALDKMLNERFSYSGSTNSNFADVNPSVFHYDQIRMAEEASPSGLGIIDTGNDNFRPTEGISRVEALAFTVRTYERYCGTINAGISPFTDRTDAPDPVMYKYMDKGFAAGLVSGYVVDKGQREFRPNNEVPRHESVAFIDKMISKVESCLKPVMEIIAPNPTDHDFGSVDVGNSISETFTIKNTGNADLNGIRITDAVVFDLQNDGCSNTTLEPNATCTFDIVFSPPVETTDVYSARISVYSDANDLDFQVSGKTTITPTNCDNSICELQVSISGGGTVNSSPSGNSCGSNCYAYDEGKSVTLTANESLGSTFVGWSDNSCSGTSCTITMNGPKSVTATFKNDKPILALVPPPADNDEDLGRDFTVKWTATDDKPSSGLTHKVRFWKEGDESNAVALNCAADGTLTCKPFDLVPEVDYNTWYVLEVTATDEGNAFDKQEWRFKTLVNKAPSPPESVSLAPCNQVEVKNWLNDDLKLTWKVPDPADFEGDLVTYLVYFNDLNTVFAEVNCDTATCSVAIPTSKLTFGSTYSWQVYPIDAYNGKNSARSNASNLCSFTTHGNTSPERPTNPSPAIAATGIDHTVDLGLSWDKSTDVDGDQILYSVYFGDTGLQPVAACQNQATLTCTIPAAQLEEGKVYFWRVDVTDGVNSPVPGEPWSFQTLTNQPPDKVVSPIIKQGDTIDADPTQVEVVVNADAPVLFSWQASTDNEQEAVTYRFCYHQQGTASDNCTDVAQNSFELPNGLMPGAAYDYWVIAKDSNGNEAEYDTWNFKTQESAIGYPLATASGLYDIRIELKSPSDNVDVVKYHLLRVKRNGANPEDLVFNYPADVVTDKPITRPNLFHNDKKFEQVDRSVEFCYQVVGLTKDNVEIDRSSVSCAIFGHVILETRNSGGLKGKTEVVPIFIQNANGLKIGASDIKLRYDNRVITYVKVDPATMLKGTDLNSLIGDDYEVEGIDVVDDSDSNYNILSLSIFANGDPEPLKDIGGLVNVTFNVIGNDGDTTLLELLQSASTPARNSRIDDDDFAKTISNEILIVRNGIFGVGQAYIRGDVSGDGSKTTTDARKVQFIGIKRNEATPEQEVAGDVNGDEFVDSGDSGMIIYHSLNDEWPGSTAPTTRRRGGLREGQNLREEHSTTVGEGKPTIVFSLGEVTGTFGSKVTLPLLVHNVTDLTAANLAIVFDTRVIAEVVSVERFGLTAEARLSSFAKNGILRIGMSHKMAINGSGEFALITFRLVSEGTVKSTELSIAQARLYDVFGRNFATSALQRQIGAEHGRVTIVDASEMPAEPGIEWETTPHEPKPPRRGIKAYSIFGEARSNIDKPIKGLIVTTEDKTTETNRYGDYQILGLSKGEYEVNANKESEDGVVLIEASCFVDGESCQLDFLIESDDESDSKYAIYGTVTDDDGLPIKGVTVEACDHVTTTDQTGFFVFLDLPAGKCDVTAKQGTTSFGEDSCALGGKSNCKLDFKAPPVLPPDVDEVQPMPQPDVDEVQPIPQPDVDKVPPVILPPDVDKTPIDNIYGVKIQVKDKQKRPIKNVEVQIGDITVTTDDDGYAHVENLPEGEYRLTASKAGLRFLPRDFELGNQQLLTELVVTPVTELEVKMVPTLSQKAEQGKHFSYEIIAVNDGDQTATDVFLEYELPGGTELIAVHDRDDACKLDDNVITCDLPDLVAGVSYKVDVELKVLRQADFTNVVALYSNEYPVNEAKCPTIVKPYLSVFGKATPSPIAMGGVLSYRFTVELSDNSPVKVAAGNKLIVTLPKGVKFKSSPDNCEAEELVVICHPDILSVVNPDDNSSVTISMEVVLEDPGLIKLVTKAEIMADNHSNHDSKVNTEINTQGIKVDGIVVIDLTVSMNPQFKAVIAEVEKRIIDGFANGATPFIAIVSFRDYNDIKLVTATRDLEVLLKKLKGLRTKGGGMCPEASAEAFMLALEHINQSGTIMLITDAPHYDDPQTLAMVERIKKAIVDKEINYHPIISSTDCEKGGLNNIVD